ncbi:MAG TPA: hypothetical protein VIL64_04325 [Solirubrobacteraceae bacterium]|jgi:hypothetical protein
MTLQSIISERLATWIEQLQFFGYRVCRCEASNGAFFLHARRPVDYGVPNVAIDVSEAWAEGRSDSTSTAGSRKGSSCTAIRSESPTRSEHP